MENEVSRYLQKFIADQDVSYPIKGEYDYMELAKALSMAKISDRPDMYSVIGNTIYIFEHFEIDSSPHTKKGSTSRIEINRDNKKFQTAVAGEKDAVYHGQLHLKSDSMSYMGNLLDTFMNHYKNIQEYKKNVFSKIIEKGDKKENFKFVVTFVIEDTSVFGALYFDKNNNPKVLLPTFCNEFVEKCKTMNDIDNIICSVETINNKKITWMVAKKDIDCSKEQKVNAKDIVLADVQPIIIGRKFTITKEKK